MGIVLNLKWDVNGFIMGVVIDVLIGELLMVVYLNVEVLVLI